MWFRCVQPRSRLSAARYVVSLSRVWASTIGTGGRYVDDSESLYPVYLCLCLFYFFFQAEDGIRDYKVTGVQTCALPISRVQYADREISEVAARVARCPEKEGATNPFSLVRAPPCEHDAPFGRNVVVEDRKSVV